MRKCFLLSAVLLAPFLFLLIFPLPVYSQGYGGEGGGGYCGDSSCGADTGCTGSSSGSRTGGE